MAEAAAAEGAPIPSATKEQSPPTAISCLLVDHANSRTLQEIFERVMKAKEDANVEKLAHTMAVHCRMHNQVLSEVLLPLVQKLKKGKVLGKAMQDKVTEIEGLLAKLDKTKKHLGNSEFVEAMGKKKQVGGGVKVTQYQVRALDGGLWCRRGGPQVDGEKMQVGGAMEAVKVTAPLLPQVKAAA
ncbi:hypothetical protein ABPG75_007816 [Micractinium tetrahymenae]